MNNQFTEGGAYTADWRWLNKLAYTTTINNIHNISAFVGYEANENVSRYYGATVGNIQYPSADTQYLGNGTTVTGVAPPYGGGAKATNVSLFGNVAYSLSDKYLLTGTIRRDGTRFSVLRKYTEPLALRVQAGESLRKIS